MVERVLREALWGAAGVFSSFSGLSSTRLSGIAATVPMPCTSSKLSLSEQIDSVIVGLRRVQADIGGEASKTQNEGSEGSFELVSSKVDSSEFVKLPLLAERPQLGLRSGSKPSQLLTRLVLCWSWILGQFLA